jgi:hypothetical protein
MRPIKLGAKNHLFAGSDGGAESWAILASLIQTVAIHPGEVPVFWACGVTPQAVALEARPELMITHEPGIMFLTDLPREGDSRS